jgi:hypothetical protein
MNWLTDWFKPKAEREKYLNPEQHGTAVLAGIAPQLGFGLVNLGLLYRLNKQVKANQLKRQALKQLIRKSQLDVEMGQLPPGFETHQGLYMDPQSVKMRNWFGLGGVDLKGDAEHGAILTPKSKTFSPVVMAHELGHGQDYAGKTGLLEKILLKARMPVGLLGTLGSIGTNVYALTGKKSPEQRENLLNLSSLISGVGSIPTLATEYTASRNAMKLLNQMPKGVRDRMTESGRSMLPGAFGTYGTMALAGMLTPQAMKLGLKWTQ